MNLLKKLWYCRMFHSPSPTDNDKWYCRKCNITYDKRLSDGDTGPK